MKNTVVNIVAIINTEGILGDMRHIFLLPAAEKPLIFRMVERIKSCHLIRTIIITTSKAEANDPIFDFCKKENIIICETEGDELDGDYKLAVNYNADLLVKIALGCPLIDPSVINRVLSFFIEHQYQLDYLSNIHPHSYPEGNEIEVLSFDSLKLAWEKASSPIERENSSFYILNNPDKFSIGNILWETGYNYYHKHRWNLIFEEDYLFIKKIYTELYNRNPLFGINDILYLLEEDPYLNLVNIKRKQIKSPIYRV
jgi:spore coat polysaccharide biosynthesis protein SpsF